MAAYAAIVSLAKVLEQIPDQYFVSFHDKEQFESLQENIIFLLTFLDDFPAEAATFEVRITAAANETEDMIEYHLLHAIGSECGMSYNWQGLYNELEKVIKEIHSVVEEAKLSNRNNQDLMSSHSPVSFSSSHILKENDTVVGLEEDLMKIKGQLYGEQSKLQIIPIVGMGGIGKTTLAQCAFDDPLTLHHFDVRAWVSVSQNYIRKRIFLGLLKIIGASAEEQRYEDMDAEKLLQHVYKNLRGRRYLIVIDDIWDTKVWDDIKRMFSDDLNRSRIVITSRDLDVASYVNFWGHPHEMRLMGEYQSWMLLQKKVFGQDICPTELVHIGNQIAGKCRGLPLAIAVTAGVLSKVCQTQDAWEAVASNVNEAVNTSGEPIADILSLSYIHLPHHLRPCFLYIGLFPEDYEINVSVLTKLWAAEGFLNSAASKLSEEVGEDYLEDLAKRSLVLINKKKYNGKIKTIKIHDLLRDFCLSKAHDEKFLQVIYRFRGSFPEGIENSHRLSIFSQTWGRFPDMDVSCIHTLLLFEQWDFDSWKTFRLLRVVDANTLWFTSFSDEICDLILLRYLAVSFRGIQVPESWSKLQNLQTLIIGNFQCPSSLPFGIWRMSQLRHVIVSDGFLHDPPAETCDRVLALENLQTLKRLRGFTCSERILELIPNLRKLGIFYSIRDIYETGWSKYGLNNLIHLHKLEKLNLYAIPISSQSDLSKHIAFPVTLKKLSLIGSGIPWEDMSIIGTLPNLQVLKLRRFACLGFEWVTTYGQFGQLKQLLIERTDPHRWTTESSHFPRLECLRLYDCHSLGEIPYSIGEIPTLQSIEVNHCNLSIAESAKLIGEDQHSLGSDLQIHLY